MFTAQAMLCPFISLKNYIAMLRIPTRLEERLHMSPRCDKASEFYPYADSKRVAKKLSLEVVSCMHAIRSQSSPRQSA
jgi:hypothetical protein